MKIIFFILVLTVPNYGKPVDNSPGEIKESTTKLQPGNSEGYHKLGKQDEDGDDGDDAAGGIAAGLGSLLGGGGSAASSGPSSVTGLLLNGLTGGLFAGFIPGETGQAVSSLYNQFTGPLNKFLEGSINAGVKNFLATTTLKTKAPATLEPEPEPTTPQNNVIIHEVNYQELSQLQSQLSSNPAGVQTGAIVSSPGGQITLSNFNQQIASQNQNNFNQQIASQNQNNFNQQIASQNQNNFNQQIASQNQNNFNQQIPQNQNNFNQQIPSQNQNNASPLANAIVTPKGDNQIRINEPYITNLADLKYLNGNQGPVSPLPSNANRPAPAPQSGVQQRPRTSTANSNTENATEEEDGEDGEDEDNSRS